MTNHDEDCVVCGGSIGILHFTTAVGDDTAHERCASDRSLVAKCDLCGQLAVREDDSAISGWGRHDIDELCPSCLADRLAEVAAENAAAREPMRDAS